MKSIYKKVFVIFTIVSIIFIIYVIFIFKNKTDNINNENIIEEGINYYNDKVLTDLNEFNTYFKDRYITINNNELFIGKNKNELDNGYYDVRFKVKEKYIEIYVNKLFKEFDKNTICDEGYVYEIVEYITKIFNLEIDKKFFSDLIISNYEAIRDIDRKIVEDVDKSIVINKINVDITTYENILVLKMGDK